MIFESGGISFLKINDVIINDHRAVTIIWHASGYAGKAYHVSDVDTIEIRTGFLTLFQYVFSI